MRYIIPLFMGAIAIGWFMPVGDEPSAPVVQKPAGAQLDEGLSGENSEISDEFLEPERVVLKRQRDGHFYARADVDGTNIRFLIDTGASAIALSGADAEALGLEWDEDDLQKVGRGVSGDVFGKMVMLQSVQVGRFSAENVQAAIIPNGLDISLLGQSFLSQVGQVNIQNDEMILN